MKKILYLPTLLIFLSECYYSSQKEDNSFDGQEFTHAQLDSIRHKEINDSINNLDTIKLLGSLFMKMTPKEYQSNHEKVSLPIKIDRLQFNDIDTALYHNVIHGIDLHASLTTYADDLDDMAYKAKYGEETFHEVVKTLSQKYGKGCVYGLTKMNDNGFQYGNVMWIFDSLTVEYQHTQNADVRDMKHHINAKIKYYIPRIETAEEERITDSIINAHEKQRIIEEKRNEEAIKGL